ncbi:MAG: hypothetical protein U0802_13295 [Candidatus Binatia bacterium]
MTDHANDQLLFVDLDAGTVTHVATGHQPVALAVTEIANAACWPAPVEPTPTLTPVAGTCAGDCDADGSVAINELILGVHRPRQRQRLPVPSAGLQWRPPGRHRRADRRRRLGARRLPLTDAPQARSRIVAAP